MSTFGVMQERIRDEINRGTAYDTAIRFAIQQAIDFYKGRRFTWNVKRAYTTTAAGQEFYALESDMLRIKYTSGNFTDPMDEVTYRWIEEHRRNVNYRSDPEKFALQARELRLWPVPDDAYEIQLTYLYHDSSVSASASDGATNSWMTEGYELIKTRAKIDVLENTVGGVEALQAANQLKPREIALYNSLKRRSNRERSSGRVTPKL